MEAVNLFVDDVPNVGDKSVFKTSKSERRGQQVSIDKRIGVARGKLEPPRDFDRYNDEIAAMMEATL